MMSYVTSETFHILKLDQKFQSFNHMVKAFYLKMTMQSNCVTLLAITLS
jgi:hypothetical protein